MIGQPIDGGTVDDLHIWGMPTTCSACGARMVLPAVVPEGAEPLPYDVQLVHDGETHRLVFGG